ncbi:hypothetical protein MHK_002387 [Candidatus Magnetomorum sp. HK-1]|nr:hypothetical protein MHK_002387 [Candidatus Magnetomorum sp. HK-1]
MINTITQGVALGWYVMPFQGKKKKCPTFWECARGEIACREQSDLS